MMSKLQQWNLIVILAVVGGLVMPATAQETKREWQADAASWLAQTPLVQITAVRLDNTETGLQILLETAEGELAIPTTSVSGNALITEISNAVLALPGETEFQQVQPATGIAQVQVIGLSDNRVRVVVIGAEAVPMAAVNIGLNGLTLSVTPGTAQVDDSDESLRILVTGEEGSRYVEPNATTATRTDTPLRDIPQSIQVIPQEVLEDQQVIRLNDAILNVSGGGTVSRSGDSQRFLLRGFESPSVLRDGFRLTFGADASSGIQELADVETIEVLKGPASILFGSLEPGGVINLVTKQPLSEPFYELGFRAGNQELFEPNLDISGPLTSDGRLLYRLNTLYRSEDSFRDSDTDFERFFIAPVISWQISDRTDLNIRFEYLDSEGPSEVGLIAFGDGIADIPFDRVLGHPEDAFQSERIRTGYDFEHRFSDNWMVRNAFRFNGSDVESSQFVNFALNETTGDAFQGLLSSEQRQDRYELQTNVVGEFSTGSIGHTLLAGVDLFRRENSRIDRRDFSFPPRTLNIFNPVYGPYPDLATVPITNDSHIQTDALGLYIQDQIELLDNLKLLLGVRYETIDQETDNNLTNSTTSLNEDAFSPRVGLVYQPIEELSLYGSYSTSFFPNSAMTIDGDSLDPERGEQFELGARAELLDGRLTANLALFHLTKQNVATPDPNNFMFSVATGEQRSQGIELDVNGEVLPGWNIIANYAYTNADITDDNSGNQGNRLFSVPENNANLWTTYDIQSGPLEGLGIGIGVNYVSERFGDNANSFKLDDYFLTNAAISYEKDNWRAGLNFRNLFDVDYIEGSRNARTFFIAPGDGFTLIGSFSIEF